MTRTPARPWASLYALCLGFFMILLDTTIVPVAIPAMLSGLSTGLNALVWVISAYLLTYAVPMLFTSRLGDRFGPKRIFLVGLALFTLASLWCGLAASVDMLIVARGAQGFGAALMTPQTLAFISHLFPPAERGSAMGVWAAVAGLGTIAGPLLGGVLTQHLGWEWIFFVNVPVGGVALLLTWWLVPDWKPGHAHSFDVVGILLSGAGLCLVVFGVQNGQQYHWSTVIGPVSVAGIIGLGVVLLGVFVLRQRADHREPLLPLQVFGNRNFSTGTLVWAATGFAMTGMFLPLVIYFQSVLALTPTVTGLLAAPMSVVTGVLGPVVGRVSDKAGGKYLVVSGLAALAAGLGLFALQASPATEPWALLPALLVCGLGFGLILAPTGNLAMGTVEPRFMGTASGIFNTARQVGGVLGSAGVGVLLQARIAASVTEEANTAAGALPEQFRTLFVESAAASAGEFGVGAASAPRLPPGVAGQAAELLTQTVRAGLTEAAKQTLLLPIGILLMGIFAAAMMRRTAPATGKPSDSHRVSAPRQQRIGHRPRVQKA